MKSNHLDTYVAIGSPFDRVQGKDAELLKLREDMHEPSRDPQTHGGEVAFMKAIPTREQWDIDLLNPVGYIEREVFVKELLRLGSGAEFWAWRSTRDGKFYI